MTRYLGAIRRSRRAAVTSTRTPRQVTAASLPDIRPPAPTTPRGCGIRFY